MVSVCPANSHAPVNFVPVIVSLSQRDRGEGKREHLYLPLPYPCAGPDLNIPHLPASIAPSLPLLGHACTRTQQQITRPGAEREPVLFFSLIFLLTFL